jgi:hypothetical protein
MIILLIFPLRLGLFIRVFLQNSKKIKSQGVAWEEETFGPPGIV